MERIDIEHCRQRNREDHLARYEFATSFVSGKRVLDLACGTGYGTKMLRDAGADVLGVDISDDVIEENREEYGDYFEQCDITTFSSDPFDVIVCFETIEHIKDYKTAIANLRKLLKHDGMLIISSPNRRLTEPLFGKKCVSFHEKEFIPSELSEAIGVHGFMCIKQYGQRLQPKLPFKFLRIIYRLLMKPHHNASAKVQLIMPHYEGRYFLLTAIL